MYPCLRLTAILVVAAVTNARADDQRDCLQQADPQLRLKSCSQLIQHNQRDAAAYQNRAVAYGLTGDLDRAISDYTRAIEIKPNNAAAYESRGRAYANKGDYTSAIADAQKASELAAGKSASIATASKPDVAPRVQQKKRAAAKYPKRHVSGGQLKSAAKLGTEDGWSGWAGSLRDKSAD